MKTKSFYIDSPSWVPKLQVDDFIVTIGKTKSNSVYHILEVTKESFRENERIRRTHIKVVNSELYTALQRDPDQKLIPMSWYSRNKPKNKQA